MKILPRAFVAVCAAACLAAPAAFAHTATKYGPDLEVTGQGQGKYTTSSVALHVTLSPSYSTAKRRSGGGGSLHAGKGTLVWTLSSVPGRPAKPQLNLTLAAPKGRKTLCVSTSMYDNYTRKTVNIRTPIKL